MKTPRRALLSVLSLFLVLVACGGDDEGSTTTVAPPREATIVIEGFAFAEVNDAAVGSEVVVLNSDATNHTWTSTDGTFDSGPIAGGDIFSFAFDAAGDYSFFCSIHPTMTGTITITG